MSTEIKIDKETTNLIEKYKIDVVKEDEKLFHLLFKHRQNKRYSSYWFGYFNELFTSGEMPFEVDIDGQKFEESLSITLKIK